LLTAVAVVSNVGGVKKKGMIRETCCGGAAVYIPAEESFGQTGVFSSLPAHVRSTGAGKMLVTRDIPVGEIRAARHGRPEVWPGPWDAKHINITRKLHGPLAFSVKRD
jgi:hypothetical protein